MPRALRSVPPVDASLGQMPDSYLQCRDLGHAWQAGSDTITRSARGRIVEFSRQLFCGNCKAEAWDRYETKNFTRIGTRKIDYPDGYLTKGSGRIPRSEARRVLFRL